MKNLEKLQLQELTIEEQVNIDGGADGDFATWYGKYLGRTAKNFVKNPFGGANNVIDGFINAF
ncbi:hypothetical protein [Empedobacter brevis]|uniref:hypothetical protein n=1 Tax=Empedobacter brevis TaxID=247 RepID=UPI0028A63C77|nr:hypothetical protein [Empedobacter brevis]